VAIQGGDAQAELVGRFAISGSAKSAIAALISSSPTLTGRPPLRPRARSGLQAGIGAHTDDGTFELRQGAEDMEEHSPADVAVSIASVRD